MQTKISLKMTWMALILFAALLPVTIVLVWYGQQLYNNKLSYELEIEYQKSELLRSRIESEIGRIKTVLVNKSDPILSLLDKTEDREALMDINKYLAIISKREQSIHELILYSKQADIIAAIDPFMGILGDKLFSAEVLNSVAVQLGFNKAENLPEIVFPLEGKEYIGSPREHDGFIVLSYAIPVGNPVKGVLVAIIDVEKIWPTDPHNSDKNIQHYILDQNGTLLTKIDGSKHKVGDLMTHMAINRAVLTGKKWDKKIHFSGVLNKDVYGTAMKIPLLNWSLVSEVPVSRMKQSIVESLKKVILFTLLGITFFIFFVLYLAKKTLMPIQLACNAIEHVAKGEYKFILESSGIRELDEMTAGFNNMAKERESAEDAAAKSAELNINIIEKAPVGIAIFNDTGQCVIANEALANMVGSTQKQILSQNYTVIRSWRESGLTRIAELALDSLANQHFELPVDTTSGNKIILEGILAPLPAGGDLNLLFIVNDVTERIEKDKTLLRTELEQREILNTMIDAVITIDECGLIQTFNKAAEAMFGYTAEELVGQNVKRLMPESFADKHDGYLQHYMKTGDRNILGIGRDVDGLRKSNEIFPMRLSVAELPNVAESGKRRFIGSCLDLTQAKLQEEQLQRAQKMDALGKLTGGIAHDYNNILGVIVGYANLLEGALSKQPKLFGYANEIVHASNRGAKLAEKLLAFTRKKPSDSSVLDINKLLQGEQHMLSQALTARINLEFDLEQDLWPVWLDGSDLEDVILNLSINAMHAMESSGKLTIQTKNRHIREYDARVLNLSAGDYVLLSVIDTGCGIDEEIKEKIFDPFYSTKGEKGTGLGLNQVYGFVDRSGGSVEVLSELGHGTQFTLYLPRYIGNVGDKRKIDGNNIVKLSGNETILVVDDELAMLDLGVEILSQQGYNIFSAQSGEQALQILENESIDLLFSDVIMPGMDGFQLAVAAQKKYPALKTQLASGYSDDRHSDLTNTSLHQDLLKKPYTPQALLLKIRELLDK